MVSVEESQLLGNCLNLLEALNGFLLHKASKRKSFISRVWIHQKIEKVIELMDEVVC